MLTRMKIAAAAALLLAPAGGAAAEPRQEVVAIVGATVLPMEGPERLRDQTVIVRGDRIAAVGPRRKVKVPTAARTVDGRGRVLMPGLVDMHVHLAPTPGNAGDPAQRALAVMLAHGVTTARGMAGSPPHLAVRQRIESGELAGPRYYAAAPALHDQNTKSAEQGREAVRKAKAAGFDVLKSHVLSDPTVWQAVADEARKVGLATAGHVTNPVGLDRAMAAGQQVEHLDGVIAEIVKAVAPGEDMAWGQIPSPAALRIAARASDAQLAQLARRIATARSWHVPTLSLFEKISDLETPTATLLANPDLRFVPEPALKQWASQREQFRETGYTAADSAAFVQLRRRIVRALNAAGVGMMAGSDTAQAFHIWGPGLYEELQSFVAAGLTPMQALRTATVVPRDYLRSLPGGGSSQGWRADFGTVTPGARADLILLAADPSRDLGALRRPTLVIAGGRLFDRPALDAMLDRAAADAKRPLPPPAD